MCSVPGHVHLETAEMVNFMLCVCYHNLKKRIVFLQKNTVAAEFCSSLADCVLKTPDSAELTQTTAWASRSPWTERRGDCFQLEVSVESWLFGEATALESRIQAPGPDARAPGQPCTLLPARLWRGSVGDLLSSSLIKARVTASQPHEALERAVSQYV